MFEFLLISYVLFSLTSFSEYQKIYCLSSYFSEDQETIFSNYEFHALFWKIWRYFLCIHTCIAIFDDEFCIEQLI